jgi:ketosteroid isomerase-like protein
MELTEGSFHIDVQALLADDDHGVALVRETASRGGRHAETFNAHIYRMRDGMVVESWDGNTDQYTFDELLG